MSAYCPCPFPFLFRKQFNEDAIGISLENGQEELRLDLFKEMLAVILKEQYYFKHLIRETFSQYATS